MEISVIEKKKKKKLHDDEIWTYNSLTVLNK